MGVKMQRWRAGVKIFWVKVAFEIIYGRGWPRNT